MTCERVPFEGGVMYVCSRGSRRRAVKCSSCGRMTAEKLCDALVPGTRRRCSAPLCRGCAVHEEPDTDHCPGCHERLVREAAEAAERAARAPVQGELFR